VSTIASLAASSGADPSSDTIPPSQSKAAGQTHAPSVHVQLDGITVVVPSHAPLGVERSYGHWS
jgi:hypothetical protein